MPAAHAPSLKTAKMESVRFKIASPAPNPINAKPQLSAIPLLATVTSPTNKMAQPAMTVTYAPLQTAVRQATAWAALQLCVKPLANATTSVFASQEQAFVPTHPKKQGLNAPMATHVPLKTSVLKEAAKRAIPPSARP